ncbi:MAG: MotA/TolQ/ExbB proton channel family protein [Leptospiraceae bacterium]|nr:MotA/TolQ/ExbB proton channel family protein [Leptospiraceae bacterium]
MVPALLFCSVYAAVLPAQPVNEEQQTVETPANKSDETAPADAIKKDVATTAQDADGVHRQTEGIIGLILRGGWTMVGLALISTIILAFAIERFLYFRKQNLATKGFSDEFLTKLSHTGLAELGQEYMNDSRLIARILSQGLTRHPNDMEQLEKDIERRATVEMGRLERGLNLLANFGNLAPLLGFFGTVVGMRASFLQFVIQKAPTAQDLAGGVEEALITTAAGLLIAIPTYLVYNLFVYQIDTLGTEIEVATSQIRDHGSQD